MFLIKLTILYLLIYGILFITGWGLCEYICKGKSSKYKFLLTPIIGIIPLSTIPMYFSFMGVKTSTSAWITLVIFASFSLYNFIKHPSTLKKIDCQSPLLFLFAILAALPSFVVILKAGYLTSTLQSYPTYIIYLAEHYSHSPVGETVLLNFDKPVTNMLFESEEITPCIGYLFFIAAISSILGILPYKLYLILSGIAGSFIPISVFIACFEGFKLEKKSALLISFLISINITYFFWPIIGHFPFVAGIVYLILVLGFLPDILNCEKKVDYIFYSLVVAGIMSMYFQLIPYVIGVALLYICSHIKIPHSALKSMKNIIGISLITFVITPFIFIFLGFRSIEFTTITSKFTKNIPRPPYIEELLGFGQHFSVRHDGSLKYYLTLLVVIILLSFISTGLYDRFKKRDILFLSIFGFIFILGSYFYLIGFTYHFYKNSIIAVFMTSSALVIGASRFYKKASFMFIKASVVITLLVLIMFNINTYSQVSLFSSHPIVTKALMDLESISNIIPDNERILINSRNPTEEVWMSYFLKNNKIKLKGSLEPWGFWIFSPFSGKPNFSFFYDHSNDYIDYTLSPKQTYKDDIVGPDYGEIVFENEEYILSKNVPNPFLLSGWYDIERENNKKHRWTQNKSFVLFNSPNIGSSLHIKGTIPDVYDKLIEVKIDLNGKLVDKFSSDESFNFNKQYSLNKYPLKKTNNLLSIAISKTFSPNEIWDSTDLRMLGVKIHSIEILPLRKWHGHNPISN